MSVPAVPKTLKWKGRNYDVNWTAISLGTAGSSNIATASTGNVHIMVGMLAMGDSPTTISVRSNTTAKVTFNPGVQTPVNFAPGSMFIEMEEGEALNILNGAATLAGAVYYITVPSGQA